VRCGVAFFVVILVMFSGKLASVGLGSGQPPAFCSSPRSVTEQFTYGLLPLTWIIPPPGSGDPSNAPAPTPHGLGRSDLRFLTLLLTLTTFLGLLSMTMGGGRILLSILNPPCVPAITSRPLNTAPAC